MMRCNQNGRATLFWNFILLSTIRLHAFTTKPTSLLVHNTLPQKNINTYNTLKHVRPIPNINRFLSSQSLLQISSTSNDNLKQKISHDVIVNKHVLVVGGSGRVGGSVVTQIIKCGGSVTVGATSLESFEISQARWKELFPEFQGKIDQIKFVQINREDKNSVNNALLSNKDTSSPFDLVVHTAGPFQGKVNTFNGVLAASIEQKIPYVDVCDDYCTASAAKTKYDTMAKETGVPCIISTGCWPGVSSLMAKQLIKNALEKNQSIKPQDLSIDFFFFTAGSGGAGATLLVATFLILAEKALTVVSGRRKPVQAMKEYSRVNFGKIVGDKDVAHLNLLETASVHDKLGIGNVKALFGTAPAFWNTLLGVMAQLPQSLLANEPMMEKLAIFSLPIVRVVDYFAGATNAMRCDLRCEKDPTLNASALYAHENLEPCVGECVVAFCAAVLTGRVDSGVWFPEEAVEAGDDAAAVLNLASVGAHTVDVHGGLNLSIEDVWGVKN